MIGGKKLGCLSVGVKSDFFVISKTEYYFWIKFGGLYFILLRFSCFSFGFGGNFDFWLSCSGVSIMGVIWGLDLDLLKGLTGGLLDKCTGVATWEWIYLIRRPMLDELCRRDWSRLR